MSSWPRSRPYTWLDVFTDTPLTGNGLCVVHDADELTDATMLAIARETRLSETTFVQTATVDGADYRNRIFCPATEMPFAGHPSLGTAVAVAHARGLTQASFVQQTHAGLQPIDVELDGLLARASMLQSAAEFGALVARALIAEALGISTADLHEDLPPQVVSTGADHVLVIVRDAAVLERLKPSAAALGRVLDRPDLFTLFVAALSEQDDSAELHARAFMDDRGSVVEDPATGSAVGPLLGYLHQHLGFIELGVEQGVHMGRPSRLEANLEGFGIRVGGQVVVLAEGRGWTPV